MFSINNWATYIKIFTLCVSVHKQTWRGHKVYSESSRESDMQLFAKIVNDSRPLTTFTKSWFLDVWLGSGYAGFFVHPWCDRVLGFDSPNKLLQRVNKFIKTNKQTKKLDFKSNLKDLLKCKLSESVIENGHLHTLLSFFIHITQSFTRFYPDTAIFQTNCQKVFL